jgi:hypothetical protein
MTKQFEHDSEPLLTENFLQVCAPACRHTCKALRKSAIKYVKIDFAEKLCVGVVNGQGGRGKFLSINLKGGQLRRIDVDDRVECVENQGRVIH